jgi:hypothetical protein
VNEVISRGRGLAQHLREIYAGQEGRALDDGDDGDDEEDLLKDHDVEQDNEENAQLEALLAQADYFTEQLRRLRHGQESAEGSRTPRQMSRSRNE